MELDAWIPSLNLAFEFQDSHHYVTTFYYHKSQATIQKRDRMKMKIAREKGLSLIIIPCWWDGSLNSLISTIQFERPDILSDTHPSVPPISINPPSNLFQVPEIPGVGELMLASFPVDANLTISKHQWWIGEKYDGVRICWHPVHKKGVHNYSRAMTEIPLLASVVPHFPSIFLDGEIWYRFGRSRYSQTYMIIQGSPELVHWHSLRIVAFDEASREVQHEPYEERYSLLLSNVTYSSPLSIVASRMKSKGNRHVANMAKTVIQGEAEGIVLQRLLSLYHRGRTDSVIKLKAAAGDQEGVVVGIDDDNTVSVKLASGITFTVPEEKVKVEQSATDTNANDTEERGKEKVKMRKRLRVGDVVSFTYSAHSRRETPVNAVIYRVRKDLHWHDVLGSSSNFTPSSPSSSLSSPSGNYQRELNDLSQVGKQKEIGHWTAQNMRLFLINFARSRNLNPYAAETWYNIPYKTFRQSRKGTTIFQKMGGYSKALQSLFPEIDFDINAFPKASWKDINNRRSFFEKFAEAKGFDPHVPTNWYTVQIKSMKGAKTIAKYHGGSVENALMDLFPNIGLDRSKFYDKWNEEGYRRQFFEDYAKANGFDPLHADGWYQQSHASILAYQGGKYMFDYYNGNLSQALVDLFPNIGLERSRFWPSKLGVAEIKNRRKLFEDFAAENGFDPYNAEHWYLQPRKHIISFKNIREVVSHYDNKVWRALLDLFPEVGFQKDKFAKVVTKMEFQ